MSSIQLFVDGVKVYDNGDTMTTAQLAAAMQDAIDNARILTINGGEFTVTEPIVINMNTEHRGPMGFDGGGCKFISALTGGEDVITYQTTSDGIDIRYLHIKNFSVIGTGSDGAGFKLHCGTNNSWIYSSKIEDVSVLACGGTYGLLLSGSVFESSIFNCWTHGNANAGLGFINSGGGVVSAISMFGGGHRKNGGNGLKATGGPRDIKSFGQYYCENLSDGCNFDSGFTGMWGCGFENNVGVGVSFQLFGNMFACTASTNGPTTHLTYGYLAGGNAQLQACGVENYAGGVIKEGYFDGDAHKVHTLGSGDASDYDIFGAVTLHRLDDAT